MHKGRKITVNKCAASVEIRYVTQIPHFVLNNTVQIHQKEPRFFQISLPRELCRYSVVPNGVVAAANWFIILLFENIFR